MSEYLYYFMGIAVSAPLCMKLSLKYDWSKKYWDMLNTKVNESLNVGLWLIGSIIFQRAIEILSRSFTTSPSMIKLITGLSLGVALAFMPRKNFSQNKR